MPKRLLTDPRYDFRYGLNTEVSPDLLNPGEFVAATNVRINSLFGGFTKRTGTKRLHASAIGAPSTITGLLQWDDPGGLKAIVAIANGKLYHKTSAASAFTEVTHATPFSGKQTMQPFRAATSGAPLVLFIAGLGLYYWDGTTLTKSAASGLPGNEDKVIAYATRLFLGTTNFKKSIFWSKTGDGLTWLGTGLPTDPGNALVDVLSGEAMNAFEVVGGSLLLNGEDSISRFTGYSTDDIRIESDTRGLSSEIGPVGIFALKRFETAVAILAERGPHVATEAGIVPIGAKVERSFLDVIPAYLSAAAVGYHRGRKELWFALPGTGDGNLNKTVYVYSTRLQAWTGSWNYPFGITVFARYEDANGAENLIAGCSDGFVRLMDNTGNYLDDMLSDGTGGSAITMTAELAPHFFEVGAGVTKTLKQVMLDADLSGASLVIKHSFDGAALVSEAVTSLGSGVLPYRIDMYEQGKRLRLQFVDASTGAPSILGYSAAAFDMERT